MFSFPIGPDAEECRPEELQMRNGIFNYIIRRSEGRKWVEDVTSKYQEQSAFFFDCFKFQIFSTKTSLSAYGIRGIVSVRNQSNCLSVW